MEKNINNKKINSSIELLRIISMFLIILSHYSVHGGIKIETLNFGFNKLILQNVTLGNLGVDIFILISGYLIVKSKFNAKKVIKLIFQVMFYSILFYIIFIIVGFQKISIIQTIKSMFPTIFKMYWFFTAYIILYILSPYINIFLNQISKRTHQVFIVTMIVIWSIIPTFTNSDMYGNVLCQFIMMYTIGAYIRLYNDDILKINKKILIILSILCISLLIFSTIILDFINKDTSTIYFYSRTSILIIVLAINIFIMFLKLNIPYNNFINMLGSCTFGIYLIHDNTYVRNFLWIQFFKNINYSNSNWLIMHMIISVIMVYVICFIIEYTRKKLIERPFITFLDKYYETTKKYFVKIFNRIYTKTKEIIK